MPSYMEKPSWKSSGSLMNELSSANLLKLFKILNGQFWNVYRRQLLNNLSPTVPSQGGFLVFKFNSLIYSS